MRVVIAKVDHVFFEGEAQSLTAPGAEGEMTVLGEHEPLITTLRPGHIVVRAQELPGGKQFFDVAGGIMEVRRDGVTVIL